MSKGTVAAVGGLDSGATSSSSSASCSTVMQSFQVLLLCSYHCTLWSSYEVCIWVVRCCRLLVWRVEFCKHLVSFGKVIWWSANGIRYLPLSESEFSLKRTIHLSCLTEIMSQNNERIVENSSNSGIAGNLLLREILFYLLLDRESH